MEHSLVKLSHSAVMVVMTTKPFNCMEHSLILTIALCSHDGDYIARLINCNDTSINLMAPLKHDIYTKSIIFT